eukprot:CAMPEP_0196749724 /NCGR_PEP_ID=MMETSP1091-20130531/78041_1 /TAXON_ID=302021 /ORGANISM="Rhodomonas sp., Strain CCMP768" /LENGTH=73 /DNA_ID=CAMNT_0042097249 /DNA_START=45 /DNA_END=263 /DNA_ORIENTATION=-
MTDSSVTMSRLRRSNSLDKGLPSKNRPVRIDTDFDLGLTEPAFQLDEYIRVLPEKSRRALEAEMPRTSSNGSG